MDKWEKYLRESEFLLSAKHANQFPKDSIMEVVFVGRSNSGKSSTINALTSRKKLAKFSKTPGLTESINFFSAPLKGFYLVDVPGYGFNRRSKSTSKLWDKLMESYVNKNKYKLFIILVSDIRHALQPFDEDMIEWAFSYSLPIHILLNKSDKLSKSEAKSTLLKVEKALSSSSLISYSNIGSQEELSISESIEFIDSKPICSIQLFSAEKKIGLIELKGIIENAWHNFQDKKAH